MALMTSLFPRTLKASFAMAGWQPAGPRRSLPAHPLPHQTLSLHMTSVDTCAASGAGPSHVVAPRVPHFLTLSSRDGPSSKPFGCKQAILSPVSCIPHSFTLASLQSTSSWATLTSNLALARFFVPTTQFHPPTTASNLCETVSPSAVRPPCSLHRQLACPQAAYSTSHLVLPKNNQETMPPAIEKRELQFPRRHCNTGR